MSVGLRLSQLLKGAVVVTLCQNEADVKCQMDIDSSISLTEQTGKIRLTELTHQMSVMMSSVSLISPAWSVDEVGRSIFIGNCTSASFRQRVAPTAPL